MLKGLQSFLTISPLLKLDEAIAQRDKLLWVLGVLFLCHWHFMNWTTVLKVLHTKYLKSMILSKLSLQYGSKTWVQECKIRKNRNFSTRFLRTGIGNAQRSETGSDTMWEWLKPKSTVKRSKNIKGVKFWFSSWCLRRLPSSGMMPRTLVKMSQYFREH